MQIGYNNLPKHKYLDMENFLSTFLKRNKECYMSLKYMKSSYLYHIQTFYNITHRGYFEVMLVRADALFIHTLPAFNSTTINRYKVHHKSLAMTAEYCILSIYLFQYPSTTFLWYSLSFCVTLQVICLSYHYCIFRVSFLYFSVSNYFHYCP